MDKHEPDQVVLKGHPYWLLIASLIAVALPHVNQLPVWLSLLYFFMLALHYLIRNQALTPSRKFILLLATFGGAALIMLEYSSLFSRSTGVALLIYMLGLKLFELQRLRDLMLMLFLSYFIVITIFLNDQSFLIALYMFSVVLLITATLIAFSYKGDSRSTRDDLLLSGKLLAQSLPLTLMLFLLFPRIPGPLWGLPNDAYSAKTGLSNSMQPGAFDQIVQSDAIALRASFVGAIPPPEQRYWRGPVFWHTNGKVWTEGMNLQERRIATNYKATSSQPVLFRVGGNSIVQDITLEPSSQPWLLALDLPASIASDVPAFVNIAGYWEAEKPLEKIIRYQAISYVQYNTGEISALEQSLGLQLPKHLSPRVQNLALQWKRDFVTADKIVGAALLHFRKNLFHYSLTPPLLGDDPVDEFLFTTKIGFCEHYAAAFTTLMRAAGIPARVVTGYQGGEVNEIGHYLVVRQMDAHAWSEVWIADKGWVRIDPTAAVAPERVEHPVELPFLQGRASNFFLFSESSGLYQSWKTTAQFFDALNNGWNQWVIGYHKEQQESLLQSFGFEKVGWREFAWTFSVGVIGSMAFTALWLLGRRSIALDPVQRAYFLFCNRLATLGLRKLQFEGAVEFGQRASQLRSDLALHIDLLTALYIRLRYGSLIGSKKHAQQFVRLVGDFRPTKTSKY